MNRLFVAILYVCLAGLSACSEQAGPAKQPDAASVRIIALDSLQQIDFLYSIARYVAPLPAKASNENKFDTTFDAAYKDAVMDLKLKGYTQRADGYTYFLVSRVAPSLEQKWVALGGRLKPSANVSRPDAYEEVFRTWKLAEPKFTERSTMLFDKMVAGEDLSPYYTINSGDEQYIEFPDGKVHYDKEARQWVSGEQRP